MKTTHLGRRPPKRNGGFSWGRFPMDDAGTVSYRLFRRDHTGAVHMAMLDFRGAARAEIAITVRRKRHQLRDQVDEIDLRAMGVAA